MKSEFVVTREFVRGAARFSDLVYIISRSKTLITRSIAHTSLIGNDGGEWGDGVDTDWDSSAIAVARLPSEKAILVGQDGDVIAFAAGKSRREALTPTPVMIRNAKEIGGYVYACGMKRQVYKRAREKSWIEMSAPRADASEEFGFEAIDGYGEQDIYAAGWGGEIWHYDGGKWVNQSSPTNVILTAVCCAPNGVTYIAGQRGVLISGTKGSWRSVQWSDDEITADLWDLCWFGDRLYVATINGLFTLDGNDLVAVDFGDVEISTCFNLTTAEGVLWSIGRDEVASFDGATWRRYD